ncbi:esterase E4 isoform X2 [Plodia interpunctella]|uniref:esterase E4 isoform X2 n=1 Tax=Plodia interpunctella TaxID=58824 RepID=UPI002368E432|nr:esterase E4-like isoform X2 [Plodia interpunctella]
MLSWHHVGKLSNRELYIVLAALLGFAQLSYLRIMEGPIVEIEQGKLQGKICGGYSLFKSIPYAKPPVGELRFSAPVPPEPWSGVRDATKDCDICAQFDAVTGSVVGSEDCLYLNVTTPKLPPGDLLPVMFYIHGGGFVFGNGTDVSAFGAEYLIKKNVVVVSINYRLGVFGFVCLDRKEATGNMGLRDQVQALKWVQNNISKFGGDPANVTIFGISAGGASVEYLMLSPMAKGLFQKAIAQSGSSLLPWSLNDQAREHTRKIPAVLGQIINDDTELLKYLMELSTKDLAQVTVMLMTQTKHQGGIFFGFVPTIEKTGDWEAFLDKSPYTIIKEGKYSKVPFISGFCTREGLIMDAIPFSTPLKKLINDKNYIEVIDEYFGIDISKANDISQKFTSLYEKDNEFNEPDGFAIDFFSDVDFIGGIYTAASWMVEHNPSIYLYEFAYDGNMNHVKIKMNIKRKGACHGDDGGYLVKADILESANITETDKLVRERMIEMWTNFSKYGVPTKGKNEIIPTNWEPMGKEMKYLVIDETPSMQQDPYPQRTHFFKSLYDTYYSKKH